VESNRGPGIVFHTLKLPKYSMAPSSSLSREVARARRTWLSDCAQSHGACGKGNISQLPLRILDVQIRGSDDKSRLVDFSRRRDAHGRSQYDRYCALSYCWGEFRSRFITTSATIKSNRRGIPVKSLPKTFYDAVIACRELKVRYLWIDCLLHPPR
jgi:hypothetical protein